MLFMAQHVMKAFRVKNQLEVNLHVQPKRVGIKTIKWNSPEQTGIISIGYPTTTYAEFDPSGSLCVRLDRMRSI